MASFLGSTSRATKVAAASRIACCSSSYCSGVRKCSSVTGVVRKLAAVSVCVPVSRGCVAMRVSAPSGNQTPVASIPTRWARHVSPVHQSRPVALLARRAKRDCPRPRPVAVPSNPARRAAQVPPLHRPSPLTVGARLVSPVLPPNLHTHERHRFPALHISTLARRVHLVRRDMLLFFRLAVTRIRPHVCQRLLAELPPQHLADDRLG